MKKTIRFVSAALTLGALAACPTFAQDNMSGSMGQGGMSGASMDPMAGMSAMERYRRMWAYYNLDEREMKRYKTMGLSDDTIKGAANVAMRTGLDMGYVVRRLVVTGEPIRSLALQLGVASTAVGEDIPGMGESGFGMSGSMSGGTSGTGMGSDMGSGSSGSGSTGTGTGTGNDTPATPATPDSAPANP
jgi:hypothetical protein